MNNASCRIFSSASHRVMTYLRHREPIRADRVTLTLGGYKLDIERADGNRITATIHDKDRGRLITPYESIDAADINQLVDALADISRTTA